jgi:ketosteroid isomerase-like protein
MPVTEDDVAHVRRAFAEFNARYEHLDDELEDYHAEFYTPDSVLHNASGFPVPATYEGFAGYERWWTDSYGPYEGVQWEIESVDAVGERVVAVARSGGRAIGDPTWLEIKLAMTYVMHDGRIARVDVFLTPEAAFDHARARG